MLAAVMMANMAQPQTSLISDCPVFLKVLTFAPPLDIRMICTQLPERVPGHAGGLVRAGSAVALCGKVGE